MRLDAFPQNADLATVGEESLQALLADCWPEADLAECAHWARQVHQGYASAGRYYHNLEHLAECLAGFASCKAELKAPQRVCMALLFHDLVYLPTHTKNEADSAELARQALQALGAAPSDIEAVSRMVLATQNHQANGDADTQFLLDIDLSVLGSSPARFARYEADIRREYAHVVDAAYQAGRRAVMTQFARRARLFGTDLFHTRLHPAAQRNLAAWR